MPNKRSKSQKTKNRVITFIRNVQNRQICGEAEHRSVVAKDWAVVTGKYFCGRDENVITDFCSDGRGHSCEYTENQGIVHNKVWYVIISQ